MLPWLVVVASLTGCGGDDPACADLDLDGWGAGCELGDDCDDTNPLRTDDCNTVPPPDCAATPIASGCPCLVGASAGCYAGSAETRDVGPCRAGRITCVNSHWGLCEGEVLPRGEICDDVDQDCDGIVDDGVRSPCGGCTPGCRGAVWGEGESPFEAAPGLALGPMGSLTLAREATIAAATVWIANSEEGTVSRIDAASATETARYRSGGSEPSRVAVDYNGDAWVANREFDEQPTVTRIAGDPSRCVDGDGGGLVTSTGPADVLPFGTDECVLATVTVGGDGALARALAIDGDRGLDGASGGNAWVGLHAAQQVVVVDGLTGTIRDSVVTPGLSPYAAAFDPWGTLWVISQDGLLARIDRARMPLEAEISEAPFACFTTYGLAIDERGRLFMTGFACDDVLLYDPDIDLWRVSPSPPSPRGLATLASEAWVAHTGGQLSRIAADPLRIEATYDLASDGVAPVESIGVGVDGFGQIWVASSHGGARGVGVATRFDPVASEVTAQVPVGLAPHVQGDLTGADLAGGFVEAAETSHVFDGCPDPESTEWLRVHLVALTGAAGSVEVSIRHAADRAGLAGLPFASLGVTPRDSPPYPLSLPPGGVLELKLRLATTARDGAPRVLRVGVEWSCPGPM